MQKDAEQAFNQIGVLREIERKNNERSTELESSYDKLYQEKENLIRQSSQMEEINSSLKNSQQSL